MAVDGDVANSPAVLLHELFRLHEHPARATTRVVHSASHAPRGIRQRFEHFNQDAHHGAWRVELAAALALRACELADAVFVDTADQVEVVIRAVELQAGEEVDQAGEHGAIDALAAKDLGQGAFQAFVAGLDGAHGIVDHHANAGILGVLREV